MHYVQTMTVRYGPNYLPKVSPGQLTGRKQYILYFKHYDVWQMLGQLLWKILEFLNRHISRKKKYVLVKIIL